MTSDPAVATGSSSAELPEKVQSGNTWRLSSAQAIAQALAGANSVVVYATGAIVGNMLAPSPMLAILPISVFVVGMAACILPVGAMAGVPPFWRAPGPGCWRACWRCWPL